jgi:hypothetical protein
MAPILKLSLDGKCGLAFTLMQNMKAMVVGDDIISKRVQLWYISLSVNLRIPQLLHLQEGRPEQRNLNDSAALAAKVAKKAEMKQKQEEEALRASSTTPVVRKKVTTKKEEDLDALLSVGLPGKKK